MSSSYNFKDNLTIDNNKYLKWLDVTGTSRSNIISLDNLNNVKINSAFGDLVLNSESNNSYTFLNVNGNANGVIIGSKIGIGFNTTTNMNSILTLNKNNFIGINTTTGSNDGYLGLAGSSSLNTTGSRIILYGNEIDGKLNLYSGNTANGTINLFTGDDKIRFQILNNGTVNVSPDGITSRLIINDTSSTFTNDVILSSGTASTNATTGALRVSGGMGITGSVYIQGSLSLTTTSTGNLNFSSSNPSTSYSSGAVVLTGGMGISTTVNSSSVTAGGALSIAGGGAIAKDLYLGGKFKILDSTSATSSENASVVLYGGLALNSNILSRSDSAPQIKLSPATEQNETSISFYSKNNFSETSNTGSSWTLGQNVNSVSSGNFALKNSQFGNVLSATYSGKISMLGNVYIDSQILKVPKGTTAERPVSAEQGFIRYNSDTDEFEGYGTGSTWGSLGGGGGGGGGVVVTTGNIIANSINLGVSNMFSGSFTPSNNVAVATNVIGLYFNNSDIRSFIVNLTASITRTTGGNLYEYFTLEGNQKDSSWELLVSSMGDISGFNFTITSLGQIQYTSTNITNYSNSILRYNVNEITNTGTYDRSGLETQGTLITNTMQVLNTQDVNIGVNNGALYVAGGVTIAKSLYVSSGTANISNITGTNISSGTLNLSTGLTSASAQITNENVTTSTIATLRNTNAVSTNVSSGTLNLSTGLTAASAQITNAAVTTSTIATLLNTNAISTNISSATLNLSTGLTSTNVVATNLSSGTVSATTFTGGSLSLSGNLSVAGTLTTVNITSTNLVNTNVSAGVVVSSTLLSATGNSNTIGSIITTGGNIGIATTSPVGTLDIRDATNFVGDDGGALYITGGTNGNRRLHMGYANSSNYGWIEAVEKTVNLTNLSLQPRGGNIGIGTTSPISTISIFTSNNLASNIESGQNGLSIQTGTSAGSDMILYMGADKTNRVSYIQSVLWGAVTNPLILNPRGGNVGINTTSPGATLDVSGTIRASTSLTAGALYSTNLTSTNIVGTNITSTNIVGTNLTSTNIVGTNITSTNIRVTTSLLATGNSNTMGSIFTTGGNVGMGTATPAFDLQVVGTINASTSVTSGALFSTNLTSTNIVGTNISSGTARVTTSLLATGNSNTMGPIITTGGNVGIGTATPNTFCNLHIVETSSTIGNPAGLFLDKNSERASIQVWGYANTRSNLRIGSNVMWNTSGSSLLVTPSARGWTMEMGSQNDSFTVNRYTGTDLGSEFLTINSAGNVGIGTAAPSSTLTVVGGRINHAMSGLDLADYGAIQCTLTDAEINARSHIAIVRSGFSIGTFKVNTSSQLVVTMTANGVYLPYQGTAWSAVSDRRLKTDFEDITNPLQKLSQIKGLYYKLISDTTNQKRVGVIAQDVQAVLPEAVSSDNEGKLGVSYTELIPLLIESIKELKQEFEQYKMSHP